MLNCLLTYWRARLEAPAVSSATSPPSLALRFEVVAPAADPVSLCLCEPRGRGVAQGRHSRAGRRGPVVHAGGLGASGAGRRARARDVGPAALGLGPSGSRGRRERGRGRPPARGGLPARVSARPLSVGGR